MDTSFRRKLTAWAGLLLLGLVSAKVVVVITLALIPADPLAAAFFLAMSITSAILLVTAA